MIYTNLTEQESVHLSSWPKKESLTQTHTDLFSDMNLIREIAEAGQRARKEAKIKVRQPLLQLTVTLPSSKSFINNSYQPEYERLLRDELNIKKITFKTGKDDTIQAVYDTRLTKELEFEGAQRELVREIQTKRKELGIKPDDLVDIQIPQKFESHILFIQKKVLARNIIVGPDLQVRP